MKKILKVKNLISYLRLIFQFYSNSKEVKSIIEIIDADFIQNEEPKIKTKLNLINFC